MSANVESVSLSLVRVVETCWATIRRQHPQVPDVVVTFGAGSLAGRGLRLGHFAHGRWRHGEQLLAELFVGGEGLQRGARPLLATLIHEAAHGLASVRGIQDTSRQGRYHNSRFRDLGRELGLELSYDRTLGWSPTELAAGTAERYAGELGLLQDALTAYRLAETRSGRGRKSNNNGVTAACSCPRQFRIAPSVLAAGEITCGICGQPFTPMTSREAS